MALSVVGAGFGRTGTFSLKAALEALGLGPCHHMTEIIPTDTGRIALWTDANAGQPDWPKVFAGYVATVDWPSAAFVPELAAFYPEAKVILSTRSVESWYESFSSTIETVLTAPGYLPENMIGWRDMAASVIFGRSLGGAMDKAGLIAAFKAHEQMIRDTIPPQRLLVHRPADGWDRFARFRESWFPRATIPAATARTSSSNLRRKRSRQSAGRPDDIALRRIRHADLRRACAAADPFAKPPPIAISPATPWGTP